VQVIVVLPAYNESSGIASLIQNIQNALSEAHLAHRVLVVDDGSTDESPRILTGLTRSVSKLQVVRHEVNQGLGAAIRDGLHIAAEAAEDDDIIVTMDADETHAPALILRMVASLREGYDVVIASRYQPGSRVVGLPAWRELLSTGASTIFRAVFPIRGVRDYTCGYRGYRASILKGAIAQYGASFVDQEGFACMVDILLKIRGSGAVFGEVPMVLRYDRKHGASKMHVGKTIVSTLKLLVRRRLGY